MAAEQSSGGVASPSVSTDLRPAGLVGVAHSHRGGDGETATPDCLESRLLDDLCAETVVRLHEEAQLARRRDQLLQLCRLAKLRGGGSGQAAHERGCREGGARRRTEQRRTAQQSRAAAASTATATAGGELTVTAACPNVHRVRLSADVRQFA
jgi:hypothetical protein